MTTGGYSVSDLFKGNLMRALLHSSKAAEAIRLPILALLLVVASAATSIGQTLQLNGTVRDSDGLPLRSVVVRVKGTKYGTYTSIDGTFRLGIEGQADSVSFALVGYKGVSLAIPEKGDFVVVMQTQAVSGREVVVTALGIEKDTRSLGYATQSVDNSQITVARETNVVNQLAGKVAGVTVIGSPSGVGGSARVSIRGERSLNIGNNQPLYVVDGVPISNQQVGSAGRSFLEADYGNGAAYINPDDIETMNVLKGPSATALYGSRANNGVILITTRNGKGTQGIGVSVNSNVTFESALRLPDYQNVYGQGLNGQFEYKDGNGGGLNDGVDESWGPKFDPNLKLRQFDSPRTLNGQPINFRGGDLSAPVGSEIVPTPWVSAPDNIANFFETGRTITNNVAVSGSNANGDFRLSLTNLDQTGIVPNTDLQRNTLAFAGGYQLSKQLSARAVVNYVKTTSGNRPNLSYGTENIMYLFSCWLGRQVNLENSKDYWQRNREGLSQFGFNYNYHDNPYFNLFENTNGMEQNRVFGNALLKYDINDNVNVQLRTGLDFSDEGRDRRRAFSTQRFKFGTYRNEAINFTEWNTDLLVNANIPLNQDMSLRITAGANSMDQRNNNLEITAPQLLIPDVYNLSNTKVELQQSQFRSKKLINSIYGNASYSYKNILFAEITARNDWSSTLPTQNNSYFYPSANVSAIISDMLSLPSFINFTKVRLGAAQVGNDTDPYQLQAVFQAQNPYGDARTFAQSSRLANADLKPEISTSLEAGLSLQFLDSRIGLDVTFYDVTSKNQILPIPLSTSTGYSEKVINAGEIRNYGVEIIANALPIKTDDFNWDLTVNASRNVSEVISLADGIKSYVMAAKNNVFVEARVGERMGAMYGIGYERVTDPNSPFFGRVINNVRSQIVKDANGNAIDTLFVARPRETSSRKLLGNYNPDWLFGINNNFTVGRFTFGFLLDIRVGGQVYSHTQTVGREGGQIIETLEGRADGYDITKEGNGVYAPGVVEVYRDKATGARTYTKGSNTEFVGYEENTDVNGMNKLTSREWHTAITNGRRIVEPSIFDASFVKLRELRVGYSFPNSIWADMGWSLRNVTVTLVGRNLWLQTEVPHIDPETMGFNGGQAIPGIEAMQIPTARSYGINVSLSL
ncbi:MAG: SusC/RagA family TonB-linked outer membrane protein [Candidatus Kapabacteria bacterium]|nr:SusC/RagA family TonB-linked outer membrane protein [Candidatus Kapabacteria bacterium]